MLRLVLTDADHILIGHSDQSAEPGLDIRLFSATSSVPIAELGTETFFESMTTEAGSSDGNANFVFYNGDQVVHQKT